MTAAIPNWSFSTLMMYEQCAFRIKLKKIEKLPEKPRDPKTDPLERGNREHGRYELFIKGDNNALIGAEAKQLAKFEPLLKQAQTLFSNDQATAEQDWLFNSDWDLCDRSTVWLWAKLDLNVQDEEHRVVIPVDFKTGKSAYKVVEHVQQLQLYAGLAALKFEWADTIVPELWYVDEGWIRPAVYTREQALVYIGLFQRRADRLMSEKFWRPNPNRITCRWCPYGVQNGTAACPVAV